jgi:hypothetical protein
MHLADFFNGDTEYKYTFLDLSVIVKLNLIYRNCRAVWRTDISGVFKRLIIPIHSS